MRSAHILLLAAGLAAPPATADLYVSGFNSGGVYRFEDGTGQPVGTGVFIQPGSGGLALPHGVLRLADGTVLVASAGTDEVLRYAPDGSYHSKFIASGQNGVPPGTLDYPVDLVLGPGGHLLVSSQLNDRVVRFDAVTGAHLGSFVSGGLLDGPSGLAYDASSGAVFAVGRFGNHVRRFQADGAADAAFAPQALAQPFGAALDPVTNRLFVSNGNTHTVRILDAASGATLGTLGGGLSLPVGARIGPEGDTYVASYNDDRIARFDTATGVAKADFVTVAAAVAAGLDGPNFFAFLPDLGPRDLWRWQHFGTITINDQTADSADPDHDGLPNLLECATSGDPRVPGPSPFTSSLHNGHLTLRVAKAPVDGLVWSAEVSEDLATWSSAGLTVLTQSATTFEVQDATPVAQGRRRFLRLSVRSE